MNKWLTEYFYHTRAERNGVLVLTALSLLLFLLPNLYPHLFKESPADFTEFEQEIAAFQASQKEDVSRERHSFSAGYTDNETEKEEITSAAEPFHFDPNVASEDDLRQLGLPARVAKTLLNFRSKGGVFRQKEDLKKVYGLSEKDYARLEPFIRIELPEIVAGAPQKLFAPQTFPERKPLLLDVNSASEEDWQKLSGIGAFYAQKIVNFRDKLGGFYAVEQVAETYRLPDSVFQKIKPHLQFSTPVFQKIAVNSATADQLDLHPYCSKQQAAVLVKYRAQHGNFGSIADVAKTGVFKPEELKRLEPYLDFGAP